MGYKMKGFPQHETQAYMGRGQLVKRLAAQVGDLDMAIGLLKKRGDMYSNGMLTPKGQSRNAMTAEERAIDRKSKETGKPPSSYKYNRFNNRATLRK